MGRGSEVKTRDQPFVLIQEKGEIFFFYRPKVGREEAHSVDDVQRLYIVLRPESGEKAIEEKQASDSGKEGASNSKGKGETENEKASEGGHGSEEVNIEKQPLLRFIVMGKKSLPDPSKRSQPYWGFVEMVTTKIDDVKNALKGDEYDTATRGHRHNSSARALAEGVYRILKHEMGKRSHTHLVYKLEFPPEDKNCEPQESLNIEREASFLIQIKNPEQGGRGRGGARFGGLKSKRRAAFPSHLQGVFGHLRYSPADPPDLLNYEGCEFLLISASDDIDEELGLEVETEGGSDACCSDLINTFGETGSTTPLLKDVCKTFVATLSNMLCWALDSRKTLRCSINVQRTFCISKECSEVLD